MQDGVDIDPQLLITVLQNKLAQSAIREAQMEAVIQGLFEQQNELMARIPKDTEVQEDASADG